MQWDSKNLNCNIYFTAVFITRLGYAAFPVGFGFIAWTTGWRFILLLQIAIFQLEMNHRSDFAELTFRVSTLRHFALAKAYVRGHSSRKLTFRKGI